MRKALLIGLNAYNPQKPLRGCLNDVDDLAALLSGSDFSFDQVSVLKDAAVTGDDLLARLSQLLSCDPGENDPVRVFHFSGHGGRALDDGGDEDDQIDENLCMGNYVWSDPTSFILDDTLAALLKTAHVAAPHMRVYVTLDCCHSGTGTKDVSTSETWEQSDLRARVQSGATAEELKLAIDDPRLAYYAIARQAEDPPNIGERPATAAAPQGSGLGQVKGGEPTTHLLLSGCAAAQTCKDAPIEGRYNGVFTYAIVRALRADPSLSWAALSEVAGEVVKSFNQNPQLEGPPALKSRRAFS